MSRRPYLVLLIAIGLGLAVPAAPGQTSRPERDAEPPTSRPERAAQDDRGPTSRPAGPASGTAPRGLLAGPAVEATAREAAAPGAGRRGNTRRNPGAARAWFRIVRDLEDLSDTQREAIRAIVDEMGRTRRRYEREHGSELRRLRGEIRRAREAGEDAAPSAEVRRKVRELEGKAQTPVAYQRRIWTELTAGQRAAVRAGLQRLRRERAVRQERDRAAGAAEPGPR